MSDEQKNVKNEVSDSPVTHLQIEHLVRYFYELADLYKDSRIGNTELSYALRALANALKPHSKRSVSEIGDVIGKTESISNSHDSRRKSKVQLPPDLNSLSEESVDQILQNQNYTKLQLIELGVIRFGISQSRLARLNRDHVVEAVRAALNHERSIEVISEEARRGGQKRSS